MLVYNFKAKMKIRFLFALIAIVTTFSAVAQEYTQEKILYKNGNTKEEGTMYLGLRFGTWNFYSPDGKLAAQTDFYKDMLHGENISYYENGNKHEIYNYRANSRHGACEEYYENGKPKLKGFYNSNVRDSIWQLFYDNGNQQSEIVYDDGKIVSINKFYTRDGKQTVTGGNGSMINYYDSGAKNSEGNIKSGVEDGKWVYYHENGKKKALFRKTGYMMC